MDTIGLLERVLNIRGFYQRLIAGNIANSDTPHYKEKDIDFSKELEKTTEVGLGKRDNYNVIEKDVQEGIISIDGNTINIEGQIVKLNENSMLYNTTVQIITKKFSMIKYAISEGKR
jgi:flagellar basal-body rod protein FlgB